MARRVWAAVAALGWITVGLALARGGAEAQPADPAAAPAEAPQAEFAATPRRGAPRRAPGPSEPPPAAPAPRVVHALEDDALPAGLDRDDFDRSVFRQRFAVLAVEHLLDGTPVAEWDLFEDATLRLRLETLEWTRPGRAVWRGRPEGDPDGLAVLQVVAGRVTGNVALSTGELFAIDTVARGVARIREIHGDALPPCGTEAAQAVSALPEAASGWGATGAPPTPAAAETEGEPIDVLLLYTPAGRAAEGVATPLEDRLELLVEWSNALYQASGTSQQLRLAGIRMVAYDDSHRRADRALDELTARNDGVLDEIHGLRDDLGADMVTLFTAPMNVCGLAWVAHSAANIHWFASYMFSVVTTSCVANPTTFTHELGHNQGAYHDPQTARTRDGMSQGEIDAVPWPNSFGYIAPGNAFHTVMAYRSSCGGCPSLARFSNPDQTHQGMPTGNARSDVRTTLEQTHARIAAFREAAADPCEGEIDFDGDGRCNATDNCTLRPNASQTDGDSDGYGDVCDADLDGDGTVGASDVLIFSAAFAQASQASGYQSRFDLDGDGRVAASDYLRLSVLFGSPPGPSGLACAGTTPCP